MMDATSMPEDQMRLFLCLFLQIFVGLFMNTFVTGGPTMRYLFNMLCGVFLTTYMFRETSHFIFLEALGAYLVMNFFPREKQQYYTVGFVIACLSSMHARQMYLDYGGYKMDVTSYTMILTTKLWGLSWAYHDGGKDTKELTPEQVNKRVVKMPSVLEYFSFVYFSLGCMCAPFHEYSDFKNWIEFESHYKNLPRGLGGSF